MPRRQVLDVEQHTAVRAVELDDPAPLRVRAEAERRRVAEGQVDLTRVPVVEEAVLLVVPAGVAKDVVTAVAAPLPGAHVEVQRFGDPASPARPLFDAVIRGHVGPTPFMVRRMYTVDVMQSIPEPPGALEHLRLRDAVAARLREMIVSGELEPGERLYEGKIAQDFEISRN